MSTTLHSQILSFYDLLYTAFNTDGLFKLNTKNNAHILPHISSNVFANENKKNYKLN